MKLWKRNLTVWWMNSCYQAFEIISLPDVLRVPFFWHQLLFCYVKLGFQFFLCISKFDEHQYCCNISLTWFILPISIVYMISCCFSQICVKTQHLPNSNSFKIRAQLSFFPFKQPYVRADVPEFFEAFWWYRNSIPGSYWQCSKLDTRFARGIKVSPL